jgi:hypothetical protein
VRMFRALVMVLAGVAMASFLFPGVASAAMTCPHRFGAHQQVANPAGVQDWAVSDLKKSVEPAPGYPLAGQLWESTVTVTAVSGTQTPLIPSFSAHTGDGAVYPVLWQLATPDGISGATLVEGQTSTGKVYFDVTGADPLAVTYSGGGATELMWCCGDGMMATMSMTNCPCCTGPKPCPCCAGMS